MRTAICTNNVVRFRAAEPEEFEQILLKVPTLSVGQLTALLVATAAAVATAQTVPLPAAPPPPTQPKPVKLALTRVEAAKALSMSVRTLDKVTKRGLLRPSRATGRPLYPQAELERYLKETQ